MKTYPDAHLRIAAEGDQFYVEDLNSSNGMGRSLNEQRLSPFKPARFGLWYQSRAGRFGTRGFQALDGVIGA